MKSLSPRSKPARFLFAACLCGVGILALVVSMLLLFGWLVSEGPPPSTAHKVVTACFGLVVLASSVSCFILAGRLMKPVLHDEPHPENVR